MLSNNFRYNDLLHGKYDLEYWPSVHLNALHWIFQIGGVIKNCVIFFFFNNYQNHCFCTFWLLLDSRVDIAHLCLYNLSVIHKKKYFDSELELMTYINENWDRLHPGEVSGFTCKY